MIASAGPLLMSIGSALPAAMPEGAAGQAGLSDGNGEFASLLALKIDGSPAGAAPALAVLTAPEGPAMPDSLAQAQAPAASPELPVLPVGGKILPDALPSAAPEALPEMEPASQPSSAPVAVPVSLAVAAKKLASAPGAAEEPETVEAKPEPAPSPAPEARIAAKAAPKAAPAIRSEKARSEPEAAETDEPAAQGADTAPVVTSAEVAVSQTALPFAELTKQVNSSRKDRVADPRQMPEGIAEVTAAALPQAPRQDRAAEGPRVPSTPIETLPAKRPDAGSPAPVPANVLAARMVLEPAERPASPRPSPHDAKPGEMASPAIPAAQALLAAAPHAALAEPALTAPGIVRAETPVDFTQLVDRLVAAREAAGPAEVRVSLEHGQFGKVSLAFAPDESGLNVTLASASPEFLRAVEAAGPVPVSSASETANNASQQGRSETASSFAQNQGQNQNQSQRQPSAEPRNSSTRQNPSTQGHEPRAEAERRRGIFA